MSDEVPTQSLPFGATADEYDRARPDYPPEAVEWLIDSTGPVRILELGAGTGKLTALLTAAGHHVVAVEPVPQMLTLLEENAPAAYAICGAAEAIPLADASVDLVVCAQSFHWFDAERALPEIARVLRPGGVLTLIWNIRDEDVPWVRRLGRTLGSASSRPDDVAALAASTLFGEVNSTEFRYWQDLVRSELLDLIRTDASVAGLDAAAREETLRAVGALYDDYGRGPDGMRLPYLTRCFRAPVTARSTRTEIPAATTEPGDDTPAASDHNTDRGTVLFAFD